MTKKKYQLGALVVTDKLQLDRDEIIIEMIDGMQKYVVMADNTASDTSLSLTKRYECVRHICGCFCGLSNFLNITLGIEIRTQAGQLYTQEMFNRIFYHKQMLEVQLMRKNGGKQIVTIENSEEHQV